MRMWKTNVKISTSTKKFGHLKMSNIDIILNFFEIFLEFTWTKHLFTYSLPIYSTIYLLVWHCYLGSILPFNIAIQFYYNL